MTDLLWCPACPEAVLVPASGRHYCGACDGMFVPEAQLLEAMADVTMDAVRFYDERPGTRACPHCRQAMSRVRIQTATIAMWVGRLPYDLDRCPIDGVWFDGQELATTLANAARDSTIEAFVRAIRRLRAPQP